MKAIDSRAYREAQSDDLWRTVWQIWPDALTYEEETPFDRLSRRLRRKGSL